MTIHKKISEYQLIDLNDCPDYINKDIYNLFNDDTNTIPNNSDLSKSMSIINHWLTIDSSQKNKDIIFKKLFELTLSRVNSNKPNIYFLCSAINTIKDNIQDYHRANLWLSLSNNIYRNQKGVYKYKPIFDTLINQGIFDNNNLPPLNFKEWKNSLVDISLQNKKSDFLSLLYLFDKSILKFKHIPLIIQIDDFVSPYLDNTLNLKIPEKLTKTSVDVLSFLIKNLNHKNIKNNKNIIPYTLNLIHSYNNHNLNKIFQPIIDDIMNNNKQLFALLLSSGIKSSILSNKLDFNLPLNNSSNNKKLKL